MNLKFNSLKNYLKIKKADFGKKQFFFLIMFFVLLFLNTSLKRTWPRTANDMFTAIVPSIVPNERIVVYDTEKIYHPCDGRWNILRIQCESITSALQMRDFILIMEDEYYPTKCNESDKCLLMKETLKIWKTTNGKFKTFTSTKELK